jgi:hypothetical protein
MSKHEVTVTFTENFLQDSKAILSERDLRLIAKVISENPDCGSLSPEIPNLRSLSWPLTNTTPQTAHTLWYFAYQQAQQIDVFAITTNDDTPASRENLIEGAWKVLRIGMMLRNLFDGIEFLSQHLHF